MDFSTLKIIAKWRDKTLGFFVMVIVSAMVLAVLWQVFTRLILKNPAIWTEETSTILLMWTGILAASLAYGKKAHVSMEYFAQKLSFKKGKILDLVITFLVAVFAFYVMLVGGIRYITIIFQTGQTSPTLGIKTGYFYLCLPISAFFILTYCIEFFVQDLLILSGKRSDK
ncbi:MAG: TRAP transporter small permease [Candidatus Marinimicrobia bacterium]|nr:TRAP transporter small permease [Candidatus Neomarinimicrobiota bacterium]